MWGIRMPLTSSVSGKLSCLVAHQPAPASSGAKQVTRRRSSGAGNGFHPRDHRNAQASPRSPSRPPTGSPRNPSDPPLRPTRPQWPRRASTGSPSTATSVTRGRLTIRLATTPHAQYHSTRVIALPSAFSNFLHSFGVPLTSTACAAGLSIGTSCKESVYAMAQRLTPCRANR